MILYKVSFRLHNLSIKAVLLLEGFGRICLPRLRLRVFQGKWWYIVMITLPKLCSNWAWQDAWDRLEGGDEGFFICFCQSIVIQANNSWGQRDYYRCCCFYGSVCSASVHLAFARFLSPQTATCEHCHVCVWINLWIGIVKGVQTSSLSVSFW